MFGLAFLLSSTCSAVIYITAAAVYAELSFSSTPHCGAHSSSGVTAICFGSNFLLENDDDDDDDNNNTTRQRKHFCQQILIVLNVFCASADDTYMPNLVHICACTRRALYFYYSKGGNIYVSYPQEGIGNNCTKFCVNPTNLCPGITYFNLKSAT